MGAVDILEVTEPLDWNVENPRILIRRHDGSATPLIASTQLSDYTMSIPADALDFDLITDLSIEPARLLCCSQHPRKWATAQCSARSPPIATERAASQRSSIATTTTTTASRPIKDCS